MLWRQLQELRKIPRERLAEERYRKFRDMGREGREFTDRLRPRRRSDARAARRRLRAVLGPRL